MICDTPWVGQKQVICPALHKGPFHSRRIRPTIFDPWREVQPSGGGDLPVEIWEGCICRRKLLCGLFSLWKLIRPWLSCRSENCPLPLHQLPLSSPDTARVAFLKKFSRNFPNNSIGRQPILQLINLRSRNSGRGGGRATSFLSPLKPANRDWIGSTLQIWMARHSVGIVLECIWEKENPAKSEILIGSGWWWRLHTICTPPNWPHCQSINQWIFIPATKSDFPRNKGVWEATQ